MKNFWTTLLLTTALLQSLTLSVLAGNHHQEGSDIAHILAAGLIVQLLSKGHHGHHHHHQGRHGGGHVHSEYSPYAGGNHVEESRMSPESSLTNSAWAQRAPMHIAYAQSHYQEPHMESYSMPYYYPQAVSYAQGPASYAQNPAPYAQNPASYGQNPASYGQPPAYQEAASYTQPSSYSQPATYTQTGSSDLW